MDRAPCAPVRKAGGSPQNFFLGPRHVFECAAAFSGETFHLLKTTHELGIGVLQRNLGVHMQEARQINRREKQITKLFLDLRLMAGLQCALDFAGFFTHLVENSETPSQSKPVRAAFFVS